MHKCFSCGTIQREDPIGYYNVVKTQYRGDYFGTRYSKRYGISLDDDFENLKKVSERRMDTIENLYLRLGECNRCVAEVCNACYVRNFVFSLRNRSLLDVGCGVGVFVETALRRGYDAKGIDINREILHLVGESVVDRVIIGDFSEFETDKKFDVITMWYTLEHLPAPEEAIKKVWNMLKYGGVFAISTPNCDGASAKFKTSWYYSILPEDHIFEFSPNSLRILLSRNGFSVVKVINTGFHPERVTNIPVLRELFGIYQKLFDIGDTFEIYSTKRFR
ncbi:MAG: class I SAM-dependent methyltransferase [Brevinematia bacterium]